ncbi:hypothetical protein BGZ65_006558 [Modicella reniformis]|uniref:Peptidase A1 domain-containing protein n=1 Tax=Modicella reniformis TaxID=1440133 RepID=A0A9P6IW42_9FUNG|nr:hypothetical protein BGZ65_006558 [Modicella reniformis]
MLARKTILQLIVSIWMGRQRIGGSNEGSGGAVIFGGVDTTKYVGNFTWAPVTDKNAWKIRINAVSIAGKNLDLSGDALIDSGQQFRVPSEEMVVLFRIPGYADYCKSAIDSSDSGSEWILGASFLKNVYSVFDYRGLAIGFAHPSNIYNSLANITMLPNLSNPPQGQGNGGDVNGTQGHGNGSTDSDGSSRTLSGSQGILYSWMAVAVSTMLLFSQQL